MILNFSSASNHLIIPFSRECVNLGRVIEYSSPHHIVRPSQLFKGLNVCLHQVSPVMQPGKMEEALIARGATVSFQVHNDTNVLVTSLPYWDTFVSEAQVMTFLEQLLDSDMHYFNQVTPPLTRSLLSGCTSTYHGSEQPVGAAEHVAGQAASARIVQDSSDS